MKNLFKNESQNDIDAIVEKVKEYALKDWHLDETHGLPHWERVERNGIMLSMKDGEIREDVNLKVVRIFAYLHDKCRYDNGYDIEHGLRSAALVLRLRDTLLKELTDEEITLLETACRYHTTKHRTGIPTVDICFDADRLDLGRVWITPDPRKMATEQGAAAAARFEL